MPQRRPFPPNRLLWPQAASEMRITCQAVAGVAPYSATTRESCPIQHRPDPHPDRRPRASPMRSSHKCADGAICSRGLPRAGRSLFPACEKPLIARRVAGGHDAVILCHLRLVFLLALLIRLIGNLVILILSLETSSFSFGFSTSLFR